MKRKLFVWLTVLCLMLSVCLSARAASSRMVDNADLLFESDVMQLEKLLGQISDRHQMDVVIVTVDSTEGKTPMEYADDYYDYNGYRKDGILLLVSMEEQDWWISTTGYGITAFTDAGIAHMSNQFVPYLSEGDYLEAFTLFAQLCDEFITQAKAGDPFDRHNLPKEPFDVGVHLLIALVIGAVVALVVTGSMKSKLKTVRAQAKADDYVTPGSLQVRQSADLFLYTHLDRRERAQSRGGSSTHVSSSGTTHGGGGGKF